MTKTNNIKMNLYYEKNIRQLKIKVKQSFAFFLISHKYKQNIIGWYIYTSQWMYQKGRWRQMIVIQIDKELIHIHKRCDLKDILKRLVQWDEGWQPNTLKFNTVFGSEWKSGGWRSFSPSRSFESLFRKRKIWYNLEFCFEEIAIATEIKTTDSVYIP